VQSQAKTVTEYLAELPPERRMALQAVRKVILANLGRGYAEGMAYGMIGYHVPHTEFPPGYHCDPKQPLPFAALASQKNHMSLYLMCVYGSTEHSEWFRKAWEGTGKKLDMGKSCVRFKTLDELPLDVIGEAIRRVPVAQYLEAYASARQSTAKTPKASKPGKKAKRPAAKARRAR